MISLAEALIRERFRTIARHYGWTGYLSACLAIALLGWMATAPLSQFLKRTSEHQLEYLTFGLWLSWAVLAIISGKDLSWRINRDRLRMFPFRGFSRVYALSMGLSLISFPLAACLCVTQYLMHLSGQLTPGSTLPALGGFLLFVFSLKLSASIARSAILFFEFLSRQKRRLAMCAVAAIFIASAASMMSARPGAAHPGVLFGHILAGKDFAYSLMVMAAWVILLVLADFVIQRDLDYACLPGTRTSNRSMLTNRLMQMAPSWPGPIFHIGLLGWLRSKSALMLFVWGCSFNFFWTYYSNPKESSYFLSFIFMSLLFHSHLRGNLLGIDRGSAWIYYGFPAPIERSLGSKSLSLSFLQGVMIASLLVAGFFRAKTPLSLEDWGSILSYAVTGLLIGEISGFYFSVRYPASIDRTSQFDGSASVGGFMVGAIQFLLMLLFMQASSFYAHNRLSSVQYWMLLSGLPCLSCFIRSLALKTWVHKTMVRKSEIILNKLSWY